MSARSPRNLRASTAEILGKRVPKPEERFMDPEADDAEGILELSEEERGRILSEREARAIRRAKFIAGVNRLCGVHFL